MAAPDHLATSRHPAGTWHHAAASDGTRIAWRADGRAGMRTAIMLSNGIACTDQYWRQLVPALANERLVVRWDYRGHGRSDAPADRDAIGPHALAGDLVTVLDAAGIERVVLVGHSYGVQVSLAAAPALGGRLAGLAAIGGTARHPLRSAVGPIPVHAALPLLAEIATLAPGSARATWQRIWGGVLPYWVARGIGGTSRAAPRDVMDDFSRHVAGLDPLLLARMMREMDAYDASSTLADLVVPVLALAGARDRITPLGAMRTVAELAPRGALAVHPRATHTLPVEHAGWVCRQLAPLLAGADERP